MTIYERVDALELNYSNLERDVMEIEEKITDTGWATLPLENGAVAYNAAQIPQYRKIGNNVYVRGVFKGIFATGTVARLPEGFRPSQRLIINLPRTGYTVTRFEIETNGEIKFTGSSDGITTNTWFSFSDTSFFID